MRLKLTAGPAGPQLRCVSLGSIDPVRTEYTRLIVLVSALLASCAPARDPKELVGVWGIGPLPPGVPAACANVSTEYRDDGTALIQSAAETVTATYTATAAGNRFLLEQTNVQSNGEPNCQGRPAQYVIDHFFRKAYIEVTDASLKMFVSPDDPSPLFVFVRLK